jgi:prevent-host-death family protein
MTITTLTSRELNHDLGRAKRAAQRGPVFITDRGKPAHVLLSYSEYQRLTGQHRSLVEALSAPGLSAVEFVAPRAAITAKAADLT